MQSTKTAVACPDVIDEPHWYAAFAPARERHAAERLEQRGVEVYWPHTVSHDGRAGRDVYRSLFPAYLFVHTTLSDRRPILTCPGVMHLVSFGAGPEPIPDSEIESLRILVDRTHVEPCPLIPLGEKVLITAGPLAGVQGILVERRNSIDVIVTVTLLGRAARATVEGAWLRHLPATTQARSISPVPAYA